MKKFIAIVLIVSAVASAQAVTNKEIDKILTDTEKKMDSIAEYAGSTVKGKDDAPISMSGDIHFRIKNFHYTEVSDLVRADQARTDVDAALSLNLGVYPNSYVNVWTSMYIPYDFSAWYINDRATNPNDQLEYNSMERVAFHQSVDMYGSTIGEELIAGIDLRSSSFGAMFKSGGVLWASASPLTVWDRDVNPKLTSTFETYEEERTVGRYYKEKTFKPVKEGGRAFWTNRPFGGIMLDVYKMPLGLVGYIMWADARDAEICTRDGLRLYAGAKGDLKSKGTLDFRANVINGRLAKQKIFGSIEAGFNYSGVMYDKETVQELSASTIDGDEKYITNVHVGSFDAKGNLGNKFSFHGEVALSIDDSIKFRKINDEVYDYSSNDYINLVSSPNLALYAKIQDKHYVPITLEASYVGHDYYSPYGQTTDSRNLTWRKQEMFMNAGTYRYTHNLMGANIKIEPEFNRGRFDVFYGLHKQIERDYNVVSFEHRLNGRMEWETLESWSKYNASLVIEQGTDGGDSQDRYMYDARMATGSIDARRMYQSNSGLRGGTWETWETFVPWKSGQEYENGNIPKNKKWSNSLNVDMAYDIAHWFGYKRDLQMQLYANTAAISVDAPRLFMKSSDEVLLWTTYLHSEPAIGITDNFSMLLIGALEIVSGPNAVIASGYDSSGEPIGYEKAAIDYLDYALGFGFDWDFVPRAGLHFRYKYASHDDDEHEANNWAGHKITAETKAWF